MTILQVSIYYERRHTVKVNAGLNGELRQTDIHEGISEDERGDYGRATSTHTSVPDWNNRNCGGKHGKGEMVERIKENESGQDERVSQYVRLAICMKM